MKEQVIEKKSANIAIKKVVIYALLLFIVMSSAFMVVLQVFDYRHDFRELNAYMRAREDINAEWGRLLIEQQTFGATAQIGTRAVTQLRMYSPPAGQTVVISLHLLKQIRRNKARCMVTKQTKQTQPTCKKKSISEKNTITLDMWRFYLLWGVVLVCFLHWLVGRFMYKSLIKTFYKIKPMRIF